MNGPGILQSLLFGSVKEPLVLRRANRKPKSWKHSIPSTIFQRQQMGDEVAVTGSFIPGIEFSLKPGPKYTIFQIYSFVDSRPRFLIFCLILELPLPSRISSFPSMSATDRRHFEFVDSNLKTSAWCFQVSHRKLAHAQPVTVFL